MRTLVLASLLVSAAGVSAQHGSSPAVQVDQNTTGAKLFRAQCAGCHGLDGSGGSAGPALNTGSFRRGSSDEAIVATISQGVPGTAMPAFSFDAIQMPQVVAHLRALANARAATAVAGDVQAGEAVFRASCAGCHTPAGSFMAPDLTRAGVRLTAAQLRESIVKPNATVGPDYWSVTANTKSGKTIRGIRMNEDTHSIQYRERSGKLGSALKEELSGFEVLRTSPMPSFQGKLTDAQIDDVIAHIVKGIQ